MSTHRTDAETRQHHVDRMGGAVGPQFNDLWNQCAHLYVKLNALSYLFATAPEHLEVLNKTAPGFFALVEDTMWDDILLHICRMTDEGRDTLSVQSLARVVKPAIRDNVDALVGVAVEKRAFAKEIRDRHIAHRERELVLNEEAEPLPPATLQQIREAIDAIVAVLHAVESHYCRTTTAFEFADLPGNATNLLYYLREGRAAVEGKWRVDSVPS